MTAFLKVSCLFIYALAVAGLVAEVPFGVAPVARIAAMVLLAAHALEVAVAFRHVKLYKGPLAVSIVLTLLFGFLHWMPLARARAAS